MASPLTIQPDSTTGKDTYLYHYSTTEENCYGTTSPMKVGGYYTGLVALPDSAITELAGQTILSVEFSLYEIARSGTTTIALHRLLRAWVEGTTAAPGGVGDPDAVHAVHDTVPWTSHGAFGDGTDRVATASATDATFDATVNHAHSWSGAGLVADMQGMVDGTYANDGWGLYGDGSYVQFAASENTTASYRPKWVIEHTAPAGGCPRQAMHYARMRG
jgi:hypothetical protein